MVKKEKRSKPLTKVSKYLMDGDNIKKIAAGTDLTYHGVRNWREKGVPSWHFDYLRDNHGFTLEELHAHNMSCRS